MYDRDLEWEKQFHVTRVLCLLGGAACFITGVLLGIAGGVTDDSAKSWAGFILVALACVLYWAVLPLFYAYIALWKGEVTQSHRQPTIAMYMLTISTIGWFIPDDWPLAVRAGPGGLVLAMFVLWMICKHSYDVESRARRTPDRESIDRFFEENPHAQASDLAVFFGETDIPPAAFVGLSERRAAEVREEVAALMPTPTAIRPRRNRPESDVEVMVRMQVEAHTRYMEQRQTAYADLYLYEDDQGNILDEAGRREYMVTYGHTPPRRIRENEQTVTPPLPTLSSGSESPAPQGRKLRGLHRQRSKVPPEVPGGETEGQPHSDDVETD